MDDETKKVFIALIKILIDSETGFTDDESGDHAHKTFCDVDINALESIREFIRAF